MAAAKKKKERVRTLSDGRERLKRTLAAQRARKQPTGRPGNKHQPAVYDKPGRPKVEVDVAKLQLLVTIGCTMEECAEVLGVGDETLIRNYRSEIKTARLLRNTKIRRTMYQRAMGGDNGMLIWLSKQWLGMKDQVQFGEDPDNPFTSGPAAGKRAFNIVFIDSDGNGKPRTFTDINDPEGSVVTLEGQMAKQAALPALPAEATSGITE